ncbi:MAG: helix-turn-helix domain-containing protein [Planctomycetes bacterium]|nr:helix-turn-helix domain-containing protein [Planctomycetota bacterium]
MPEIAQVPSAESLLLSLDDASVLVGVSRDTIRRAVYAHELPVVRPGRGSKKSKIFVRRQTLIAWLEKLEARGA